MCFLLPHPAHVSLQIGKKKLQANSEKSPSRQQRHISQENSHSTDNHSPKANTSKEGSISNRAITHEHDALSRSMELNANSQSKGKVLVMLFSLSLVVNIRSFWALHIVRIHVPNMYSVHLLPTG